MPSEDPWHSGEYGTAVVSGVQWSGAPTAAAESQATLAGKRYTKINAALKHFFAYSVESGRGSTNFNISQHDIYDTYLPSFEAPIVQADAKGYMCSYASVNGQPSWYTSALISMSLRVEIAKLTAVWLCLPAVAVPHFCQGRLVTIGISLGVFTSIDGCNQLVLACVCCVWYMLSPCNHTCDLTTF